MSEKRSTCATCGYKWITGQDGSHDCTKQLNANLKNALNKNADTDFRLGRAKAILLSMLQEIGDERPVTKEMVNSCIEVLRGDKTNLPSLKECGFKRQVHKYGYII